MRRRRRRRRRKKRRRRRRKLWSRSSRSRRRSKRLWRRRNGDMKLCGGTPRQTDCFSGFSFPSDPGFKKKSVFVLCPLKHTNTQSRTHPHATLFAPTVIIREEAAR